MFFLLRAIGAVGVDVRIGEDMSFFTFGVVWFTFVAVSST